MIHSMMSSGETSIITVSSQKTSLQQTYSHFTKFRAISYPLSVVTLEVQNFFTEIVQSVALKKTSGEDAK